MTQMGIAVNRRTANIHPHVRLVQGDELFFLTRERIVDIQWMIHNLFLSNYLFATSKIDLQRAKIRIFHYGL